MGVETVLPVNTARRLGNTLVESLVHSGHGNFLGSSLEPRTDPSGILSTGEMPPGWG